MLRRPPNFLIGDPADPYIRRWWVLPRNRWFNVYLHHILRSDDDRALHDHPWWNVSLILRGGYYEMRPAPERFSVLSFVSSYRGAGSLIFRGAKAAHRLVVPPGGSAWTLFITGPRIREWGFHCPKGWVLWSDFVDKTSTGSVGRGCGEHD